MQTKEFFSGAVCSGNPHILIVEDNVTQQRIFRVLAERLGLKSDVVDCGNLAVEALQQREYQLILMDWQLPGMDGIECARRIRKIEESSGRRTPIIAVTAQHGDSVHQQCLRNGMDGLLSKPFSVEQFSAVIDQWIIRPRKSIQKGRDNASPLPVTEFPTHQGPRANAGTTET